MSSPDVNCEQCSQRLSEWLSRHVDGYDGPGTISRFGGGQSNPTYKLHTPSRDYVLRSKPAGNLLKGAHAIDREFCVTRALASQGFPVATPYAYCGDDGVIGTAFYVMDFVEGRIFWGSTLDALTRDQRPSYFDAMNATLAALHTVEPESIGLQDYGKPGNYFSRQISRWSKQYLQETAADRDAHMDSLLEWLPKNIPHGDGSGLVHGDFRIDNMIFHPSQPTVLAVLDWELSTLGHPLADFTYHQLMYHLPPDIMGGMQGVDLLAIGVPSETDYIADYCRRTHRQELYIPHLHSE